MAERRGSWPWRKKTLPKADKASSLLSPSQPASPVTSFKYDPPPLNTPNGRQEPIVPALVEDTRISEAVRLREQAEENLKVLKEELSTALEEVTEKEAMVKQHEKVAEEAVSGWEKAEKEALSYKQELEAAAKQKTILEDRVAHLDGALKECMKQVRHVKEEQERKIDETITCKTREWEKIKAEVDAKQVELERRLMESEAQNSAMTKSLQERARKIVEANEAKERAETEVKVLQVKLGSSEKEISALKYELHVLNKELEIRNEEVDCNKKSADAAHKHHLDNVKKVAKLEADCQRLRNLVRKKLPGPAAIAQMRREVDGPSSRESAAGDLKRRPIKSLTSSTISFASSYQSDITTNNRDVELLKDRMSSMEEETKLLKEALSRRNEELHASRLLCAKTANKLSIAEDHLESLQGTPTETKINCFDHSMNNESSIASVPDGEADANNVEEASCAESWASALISELALFKKGNPTIKYAGKESTESCKSIDTSVSPKAAAVAHGVLSQAENLLPEAMKGSIEVGETFSKIKELHLLCKELDCKFGVIEEQVRKLKPENGEAIKQVEESILSSINAAHQKFAELEKAVQGMGNTIQSCNIPDSPVNSATSEEMSLSNPIPVSSLRLVLCKLILLLETLLPLSKQNADTTPTLDPTCQTELEAENPKEEALSTPWDQQKQALMSSKDSFLEGKSSVSEFLVRFAIVLCEACDSESEELEELLVTVNAVESPRSMVDVNASGFLNELSLAQDQLQQVMDANAELGMQMASVSQELEGTKLELGESKELVIDLQNKVVELQSLKEELSNVEAIKVEIQVKLEAAEGEVSKLQASVASLTLELAEEKKLHEGAVVKCEELENQLQGRLIYEDDCNSLKVPDDEDTRLGKERELVAAKEKLTECQRTILALGKQLSALSSPPTELSPGCSFDSVSMDSVSLMMEQRMQMELQNGGSMDHNHHSNNQNHHYQNHHGDGRYNNAMTAPQVTAAQYNASHSSRRGAPHATPPSHSIAPSHSTPPMHATGHLHSTPPSHSGWTASRGRRVYEDVQETARSWGHSNGSFTKGGHHAGPLPETDHPHHHSYQQQQLRRPAYVSPSCQYSQRHYDGPGSQLAWTPSYVAEEEERQLAQTVYSPPHTAMSSPARSPARYTQQLNGSRAPSRTTVRTSLTESMNAAATSSADYSLDLKASKPSAFGKLFSRSKNHR